MDLAGKNFEQYLTPEQKAAVSGEYDRVFKETGDQKQAAMAAARVAMPFIPANRPVVPKPTPRPAAPAAPPRTRSMQPAAPTAPAPAPMQPQMPAAVPAPTPRPGPQVAQMPTTAAPRRPPPQKQQGGVFAFGRNAQNYFPPAPAMVPGEAQIDPNNLTPHQQQMAAISPELKAALLSGKGGLY